MKRKAITTKEEIDYIVEAYKNGEAVSILDFFE
jgi:hypothetical protein